MKIMKITSRHSQLTDVDTPHLAAGVKDGVLTPAKLLGYVAGMHNKPLNVKSDGSEFEAGTPAKIKAGSYTGDGSTSKAITGIGFQPKWVIIFLGYSDTPILFMSTPETHRYSADYSVKLNFVTGATSSDYGANRIIAIGADGFTVDDAGANADPNKTDAVYEYICIG